MQYLCSLRDAVVSIFSQCLYLYNYSGVHNILDFLCMSFPIQSFWFYLLAAESLVILSLLFMLSHKVLCVHIQWSKVSLSTYNDCWFLSMLFCFQLTEARLVSDFFPFCFCFHVFTFSNKTSDCFFIFFRNRLWARREHLRVSLAQAGAKPLRTPAQGLWSAASKGGGFRSSCTDPRAPCIETATWSRSPWPLACCLF